MRPPVVRRTPVEPRSNKLHNAAACLLADAILTRWGHAPARQPRVQNRPGAPRPRKAARRAWAETKQVRCSRQDHPGSPAIAPQIADADDLPPAPATDQLPFGSRPIRQNGSFGGVPVSTQAVAHGEKGGNRADVPDRLVVKTVPAQHGHVGVFDPRRHWSTASWRSRASHAGGGDFRLR